MPLLPLEPFIFPADLFAGPPPGGEGGNRWWVLHTRPRAEKALARRCVGSGLAFFLPVHERQWRHRGRLLRSHLPLFPGYVFLYGDSRGRGLALGTNLVARCLAVAEQGQFYEDLARVHRLLLAGAALTPEERVVPGSPVELVAGPLAGLRGTVLRRGGRLKLLVEVQFLRRGVSAEVEAWMVRPLR